MFRVECLKSTTNKSQESYGKYFIGTFLRGQSTTIGNALRRVLLSNLQGLAITGVRIDGISHEFSTIPNVKEDVIDILLNLKQVVLKGNITEPSIARLKTKQTGLIIAKDIEFPKNITLVNPHQYIASLTNQSSLEMEFLISKGLNYFTNDKLDFSIPKSFLSVDAVFMPVRKVNFFVEPSGNNSTSELESLILEIWTNGSVSPDEALSSSAEILETTFGLLKFTNNLSVGPTRIEAPILPVQESNFDCFETISIDALELSGRSNNCLRKANINTLSDLLQYSVRELLEIKNFGKKSAEEVCKNLKTNFNLELRE
jgi:DNA-directed RNA polymerase subunit alpha